MALTSSVLPEEIAKVIMGVGELVFPRGTFQASGMFEPTQGGASVTVNIPFKPKAPAIENDEWGSW